MKATSIKHRRFRTLLFAGSCVALLSSGCATIAHGRYQRVQVETSPPAAKVFVKGAQKQAKSASLQFETPGEVVLHCKEKHVILQIEKDGYEPAEVALERKGSAWTPAGGASFLGLGVMSGLVEGGPPRGLPLVPSTLASPWELTWRPALPIGFTRPRCR